ncbi:hypothetical protein B0J13DRAFT_610754 [Dactylonectria estremocensis]|uniref:Zn(2)-C6 fungal-type domain-containing protein n=1 Tax=Dactylonectria estremocensis TaxID=1079267 RepID=A0A9P9E595_9HYPO|nr:hypothetical protein B0J13DRAFT_610754 [Dactylonectria estremocensis]
MDQPPTEVARRTRKCHTRSRSGCFTCRKRRVRCDGNQPYCLRCTNAGRLCEFRAPTLPLRDRRPKAQTLPGQQQPWAAESAQFQVVWSGPLATKLMDPFGSFAINMPFKSRELLHYFHQAAHTSNGSLEVKENDILASLAQHPNALRNTLLIAGLHYAWKVGGLQTYELTFLFHKIETIRLLNDWMKDSQSDDLMAIVQHIATLCFTECSLGNIPAAETHLDGLVTVVDLHRPLNHEFDGRMEVNDELVNRYLILSWHSVHVLKSRVEGSKSLRKMFGPTKTTQFSKMISLLHQWRSQDIGSFEALLKIIRLLPYFGGLPTKKAFHPIDGLPMIECLRVLTTSTTSAKLDCGNDDPCPIWADGSASRLTLELMKSHISSLDDDRDVIFGSLVCLPTSWCGISITSGLYLHSVLELCNGGNPIDARLFRYLILMLMRDLRREIHETDARGLSDFWFWKAFVGAFSLAKRQLYEYNETLEGIQYAFNGYIQGWRDNSNVTQWTEAKNRLLRIAWTADVPLADTVWETAVRYETM